ASSQIRDCAAARISTTSSNCKCWPSCRSCRAPNACASVPHPSASRSSRCVHIRHDEESRMSLPLGSPRAGIATRPRLGEILVATGALTPLDVQRIVAVQRERGARFGEIALELGLITEAQLSCALARQIGYPYVEYGRSPLSYAHAAAYEPLCAYSEAMRTLRSQLLMRWFGHKQRALAICSPRRDDMRSAVAANLAIVFAQLGERTLLIDANLRAPLQHDLFGIDIRAGLVNVICDQCGPEQALHSVAPFDKLAVMPAVVPPNPQELLSSSAFADL